MHGKIMAIVMLLMVGSGYATESKQQVQLPQASVQTPTLKKLSCSQRISGCPQKIKSKCAPYAYPCYKCWCGCCLYCQGCAYYEKTPIKKRARRSATIDWSDPATLSRQNSMAYVNKYRNHEHNVLLAAGECLQSLGCCALPVQCAAKLICCNWSCCGCDCCCKCCICCRSLKQHAPERYIVKPAQNSSPTLQGTEGKEGKDHKEAPSSCAPSSALHPALHVRIQLQLPVGQSQQNSSPQQSCASRASSIASDQPQQPRPISLIVANGGLASAQGSPDSQVISTLPGQPLES